MNEVKKNSPVLVMIITSVQQSSICTKAPSPVTAPFDSSTVGGGGGGGLESTKFINLIPPITIAWLLQYSGSRVEHMDGFSSRK